MIIRPKTSLRGKHASPFYPTFGQHTIQEVQKRNQIGGTTINVRPGQNFWANGHPDQFLGKRVPGSEFLGKRVPGSEFLGKRVPGSEFLGKRVPGSEFLGKRVPGSEFLGKRVPGSEFLGKRVPGSEFLGKRSQAEENNHQEEVEELYDFLRHHPKRSLEVPLSVEQRNDRNRFDSN